MASFYLKFNLVLTTTYTFNPGNHGRMGGGGLLSGIYKFWAFGRAFGAVQLQQAFFGIHDTGLLLFMATVSWWVLRDLGRWGSIWNGHSHGGYGDIQTLPLEKRAAEQTAFCRRTNN